ncbi:septum formation initiator family protein [Candidatus Peregrinibacteria bacterium]|nr:septum formation initiator family protein [Candidatus Peregrinibacteria bacterium]
MISNYRSQSTFRTAKIVIILGFAMVAYMLYALTVEIYKNYQIDRHISNFQKKNEDMLVEYSQKIDDLKYYTSEAYIEKIAKQSLGLVNPGEEVIILPPGTVSQEEENSPQKGLEKLQGWKNFVRWWRFFFIENVYK